MAWDYSHGHPPVWRGPLPMTVPTLEEQIAHGPVIAVVSGAYHGYVLTSDGRIIAIGYKYMGQRNDLPTGDGFVQIAAGGAQGYALTADGHIVKFGNWYQTDTDLPTTGGFVQVVGTEMGGYALTADGHIVAFGRLDRNQPAVGGFTQLAGGGNHGYALTSDGHIVAFGGNAQNQQKDLPWPGGFVHVTAGYYHGYALTADGHIVAFGGSDDSQRKDMPTAGGFAQLAGGPTHGDAIDDQGHLVQFGSRSHNELKDLPAGGTFVQAASGLYHTYVLTADGHVIAFGDDANSQRADLPLFPVAFASHPYIVADHTHPVVVTLAMDVDPTVVPWELDWGDGTPHTTIPVGTTAATQFTHTYAADGDYTLRVGATGLGVPGHIDTAIAHVGTVQQARPQYVWVWDGTKFVLADVMVWRGAQSLGAWNTVTAGSTTPGNLVHHSPTHPNQLWVNKVDADGNDKGAALLAVTVGSKVTIGAYTARVAGVVDNGVSVIYDVTNEVGTPTGRQDLVVGVAQFAGPFELDVWDGTKWAAGVSTP